MDQVHNSLDFYQNLTSEASLDYLSNEDLDLRSKQKLCPLPEDFGPNATYYNLTDHDEVGDYTAVGLQCLNYTTRKMYLEQNPVVTTLHFHGRGLRSEYIKQVIANDSDDILSVSESHLSFLVRRTSQNKYGVFSSQSKVKVSY